MVRIRLRTARPAHNPQLHQNTRDRNRDPDLVITDQQADPLRNFSNRNNSINSSDSLRASPVRKSASKIIMELMDSPRRALSSRKKRMNAEKLASRGCIPFPTCLAPNVMDVDMSESSSGSFRNRSDTYPMEVDTDRSMYLCHVMDWLADDVPCDILPKILSFAGPRKINSLCRVSKMWNKICTSEAIFRTMCEDYGKWEEGESAETSDDPRFWRNTFCNNPIVPLEYGNIYRATSAVCKRIQHESCGSYFECDRNVRILVQPGVHILERGIVVEAQEQATFIVQTHAKCSELVDVDSPNCTTSGLSSSLSSSPAQQSLDNNDPPARTRRRLNSGRAIRNFLSCRSTSSIENMEHDYEIPLKSNYYTSDQATILFKTNKRNCPMFHIRQGHMKISNVSLIHYCRGTDIWNGNSAVQIQPRLNEMHHPIVPVSPSLVPSAIIEGSKIMSISGRGIVAIDGSRAIVQNCHVHRCAATGIYIGGAGSEASIHQSDIISNGIGNNRTPRGIARGHSGVYLEQGKANVTDCSISRNALTGLSAVSLDNAILTIQDSELVGNATLQLELPQEGSISFRRSTSIRNSTSREGDLRLRSGLHVGTFSYESDDSEQSV